MRARRGLAAIVLAVAATFAGAAELAPNKALHALFEREMKNAYEEWPEVATYLGVEGYDHRLGDASAAAAQRRRARLKQVIARLSRFESAKLNQQDRISRDVMLADLRLAQQRQDLYGRLPFGLRDRWVRVSSMEGPHLLLPFVVKATRFRRTADYDNYLKRLAAIPGRLDQEIEAMRTGMKSGWMPPRAAMLRVPEMLTVFAADDVTATPLWKPFEEFPAEVPEAERRRVAEAGKRLLAEKVHPAFARLKRFVESEYLPAARTDLAASSLPAGRAYYDLLIRESTTTDLTADRIHDIGLAEVARIRAEMDRVIATTDFKGSFAAFLAFIQSDPRFFFTKAEDRLRAYRDIAKRADAELPRLFAELPRMPYGIRPMEEYEGDDSDYYSGPAIDGSRAGYFSANVNKLQNRPSYEMETTLLHEAVPGHHLQVARALELKDLPVFRRAGGYTAYVEGWALYAETLGFDMGFFKDPYQHFGRLQGDMLRAVRLVVDTGLHAKGWSRDRAITYFVDNGAGNPAHAAAEIDRYIVLPAQALGYKVGELRIKALRDKARAALGDKFDLRRFHNALLDDGPLPLTVLEARIDQWIAAQRPVPAPPPHRSPEMKRYAAALVAAALSLPTLAQQDFSRVEVKATKLSETTYMLTGAGGNMGLSVGEDAVFLVDDQYAPLTERIIKAIAQITPKPVRFVLNTHWHGDHSGGNENMGKAGALIVAHDNVRKRMSTEQFIELHRMKVEPSPRGALPVVTFGGTMSFHLNGEELRALHMPNAHTDGDAVVHFTGSDVIHMGDIYFNGMYPFIDTGSGGTVEGTIAACDRALALASDATRIIPGHGPLSNKAELKAYRDMIATVHGRVKEQVAAGRKAEEIFAAGVTKDFDEKWGKGFIKPAMFVQILAGAAKSR